MAAIVSYMDSSMQITTGNMVGSVQLGMFTKPDPWTGAYPCKSTSPFGLQAYTVALYLFLVDETSELSYAQVMC